MFSASFKLPRLEPGLELYSKPYLEVPLHLPHITPRGRSGAISPSFLPGMVVVLGRCFRAKAIHDIVSLFTKVALLDVVSLLDVFVVCRQKLSVDLR
jgi:hypothetical protein